MCRVLELLRRETAVHRYVADSDRLALTDRPATNQRYTEYLVRTYGFHAPLESALAVAPGVAATVDVHCRAWSTMIVEDLAAVGYSLERLLGVPVRARRHFVDAFEALGWLYVADVTHNGHQMLRHYLSKKLPDVTRGGRAHVDRVRREQWAELGAALDAVCVSREAEELVVQAAIDAFEAQHRWFRPESPSGTTVAAGVRRAREAVRATRTTQEARPEPE